MTNSANTGGNIQFNVKIVSNQLTQYTVEMSSTLEKLTRAMQATTEKITGVEKILAQEQQAIKQQVKGVEQSQEKIKEALESTKAKVAPENLKNESLQGGLGREFGEAKAKNQENDGPLSGMRKSLQDLKVKISVAFSTPTKLIQVAKKSWDAFAKSVSAKAKTAFQPLKDLFNSLFGTALRNGFSALGSALITAVTSTRQMQTAIGHLKEGFNQMAAPIASAVAPALASLTNIFATVLAYAGRLFSFLTGKTVTGAEDTAQAVADVGTAAGKTAKQTEEATRTLAGFDEITRLDAPKESGSAFGGGGGGSAAKTETKAWEAHSPFLEQVLAAMEGGEWEKAGQMFAAKMNDLLENWDAQAFGQKLGTGINNAISMLAGFIGRASWGDGEAKMKEGIERLSLRNQWNLLGTRLAEGANGLMEAIDPEALAVVFTGKITTLIRTLGSFCESFDFSLLGQKLSAFSAAAMDQIALAIASVDWGAVGRGIGNFFMNLDWAQMVESFVALLVTLLRGAVELLAGLLAEPLNFLREKFLEGFHLVFDGSTANDAAELGAQIVAGLLAGIGNAVAGIAAWLYDNLFAPIANGICDAFGIHSPSTVAAEWGGFIIEGLLNGLSAAWVNVTALLDGIRGTFANVWQAVAAATQSAFAQLGAALAGIWSGITGTIRGAVNGIIGFVNGLISAVIGGVNAMIGALNRLHFSVPRWVPGIGGASFGFALQTLPTPQIPYLAQGAVIPANREFLAVLGDQHSGTNVEAPLAVIEQAVANVLDDQLTALMAGFEAVVKAIENKDTTVYIGDAAVGQAAARWQRRQAVIRGGAY